MGQSVFNAFHAAAVDAVGHAKHKSVAKRKAQEAPSVDDDPPPAVLGGDPRPDAEEPLRQGMLMLDATVAPQAIRFPTDLGC